MEGTTTRVFHRSWYYTVLSVLLLVMSGQQVQAQAQDPLTIRLSQLPASLGSTSTVVMPKGMNWVTVGIRERVGYEHLNRANPGGFTPGTTALIPGRHQVAGLVTDGLVINLPELMLFRWSGGKMVDWYPVAIGRVASRWNTPIGKLRIANRVVNPAWHRPSWAGGGVMQAGARNPLGNRWIGLSRAGYGIHGTNDPGSIGRTVSHGCIRMFPAHVQELFPQTRVDMPVIITYETLTIGHQAGIVYLAVMPDIYARGTNTLARAKARLARYGLSNAITSGDLQRRLAQGDGIARPLLGSNMTVRINGVSVPFPVGPSRKGNELYLPVRNLAGAVGANIVWEAQRSAIEVNKDAYHLVLPESGELSFQALDTTFVQVRGLIEQLGGTVTLADGILDINFQ